jgi:hypothetical protein
MTFAAIIIAANMVMCGPCAMLGQLIGETKLTFVYRRRALLRAYVPRRFVHIEPCTCCPDHPQSRYSHLKKPPR